MAGLLFLAVSSKNSFSLHFCEFVKFSLALLELMQLQCFQVFYCLFVSGRKNQKYCVYVCGSKCKSALYELWPALHRFVFNRCVSSFAVFFFPWHFFEPVANLVLKIATAIFGLPRAFFLKFATGNRESFTGTFFKIATAKLVFQGQFCNTNCHGQIFGFTGNFIVKFLFNSKRLIDG